MAAAKGNAQVYFQDQKAKVQGLNFFCWYFADCKIRISRRTVRTVADQKNMAPRVGFEPTTNRLTVDCSTTELPGNMV